jgi:hypothetical protein
MSSILGRSIFPSQSADWLVRFGGEARYARASTGITRYREKWGLCEKSPLGFDFDALSSKQA